MTREQPTAVCSICLDALAAGTPTEVCPGCHAEYHVQCWEWLGGCATYGCSHMVEVKKSEDGPEAYFGATDKTCPVCSETIPVATSACPYCRTAFESTRPVSRAEFMRNYLPDDPLVRECRRNAVVLLIASILGCTTPFAFVAGLLWYRNRRDLIEESGPTTRALVLISLGVCALYLTLVTFGLLVYAVRG